MKKGNNYEKLLMPTRYGTIRKIAGILNPFIRNFAPNSPGK